MYSKTITYTDYNGEERKEDFLFNMTEAEIVQMQMGVNGGLDQLINRAVTAKDYATLIKVFKELIDISYGEKSLDGKHFIKEDADGHRVVTMFKQTEAYSKLFMELAFNDESASDFIKGVFPTSLMKSIGSVGNIQQINTNA